MNAIVDKRCLDFETGSFLSQSLSFKALQSVYPSHIHAFSFEIVQSKNVRCSVKATADA